MSEARVPTGKKKVRKVQSRKEAAKDALPDVQPPAQRKRIRKQNEIVAQSDEDDD